MIGTLKVILRHVHAKIFRAKEQILVSSVGHSSANCPGCKAHAEYFVLTCSLSEKTTIFILPH